MPRIERVRRAWDDLLEIHRYIAVEKVNPAAADRLLRRIDEVLENLARHPEIGQSLDRFNPGLRAFPVGNYILFYRPISDGVRLIRVLHGAREWRDLLD